MSYFKVNPQTGEILSQEIPLPPSEFYGLSDEDLSDLGVTFPNRVEYQGIGFWPSAGRITPDYDRSTHNLGPEWTAAADLATKTVTSTQQVVPLTADQLKAIRVVKVKAEIEVIEASITPRRTREAVLGTDGGWLAARDAEIAALRAEMAGLS